MGPVGAATGDEYQPDSEEIEEAERQRRADRRFKELSHLNGDIEAILQGRGHKVPAPQPPAQEQRLFNSGAVTLAEDLVLGGGRNELIRLHGYFAEHFLKEQRKMTVLSNMLDLCMYYLCQNASFEPNCRLLLQAISEYITGTQR